MADSMNCLLCSNLIATFDTSAGCQDPNRSHPECDRLGVVASIESTDTTDSADSTTEETPAPLDDTGTPGSDPTEYQADAQTPPPVV